MGTMSSPDLTERARQAVTPELAQAFARDGAVCVRGLLNAEEVALLREGIDANIAAPSPRAKVASRPDDPGFFIEDFCCWQENGAYRRVIFDSPLAAAAGLLMASRQVRLYHDHMLTKEPGTRQRTPWHQDQPYWAVEGWQVCSIWLPFDPVPESTCVEYVAGSHRWNRRFNPQHFSDGSPYSGTDLPPLPDIESERTRYDIRRFALDPGDCLVFQALIVHGAPGNRHSGRRRALATRWTGDDATFVRREGEVAIPTSDPGLAHGAAMDCDLFPRIWERGT